MSGERMIRVIPRLDIKGPNLVKGVHLEGLRVLGRPELFAPKYYEDGADEIIYIDQVASLYGRNNLTDIVRRAAENIFVPLIVGGGIRSVEDIRLLLRAGADKVAINTAALARPELITEGARAFGSQCMVISIVAIRRDNGRYECLTDNAREKTGVDAFDWARKVQSLGAGELLITSVDREGTGLGYDEELIGPIAEAASIPVIAFGGAGCKEHASDLLAKTSVDAVCAASIFHYGVLEMMEKESGRISEEGNTEFLKKKLPSQAHTRRSITPAAIHEVKEHLTRSGYTCRSAPPAYEELLTR